MPRVGLEPTTPVFERTRTVHGLDRAATVIGRLLNNKVNETIMVEERCKFSPESRVTNQKTRNLGMSNTAHDRLCGLMVRVLGYRSGGPGSIPGTTRKKKE
jgi:hypothetical protein